nr:protein BPS1, chloroplastic-like [Ipomoea trifida]GLL21708.1 protein BPS1, chloroplastic-like [Ipomoea trifida]
MSRPQDPQHPYLPFKNPFSITLPKGSHLSPRLLALLNAFEESLAEKLRSLMHRGKGNALSVSWMKEAMASLSTIHTTRDYCLQEVNYLSRLRKLRLAKGRGYG